MDDHYNVYFVKTQRSSKIFFSSTEKKTNVFWQKEYEQREKVVKSCWLIVELRTEVWNSIMNEQDDNVSDEYSNKVVVAYNWLPILLSY